MKLKRLVLMVAILFWASSAGLAQSSWPSTSRSQRDLRGSSVPTSAEGEDSILISGKVIVAGGSALLEPAAIEMSCKGHIRLLGYSDGEGNFDIALHQVSNPVEQDSGALFSFSRIMFPCELQAQVPGFVSETVHLTKGSDSAGFIRVGNVVIHARKVERDSTISVTDAAAPSKAQKNFQKGCARARANEWAAAADLFREAVRLYPKYARAWVSLGRTQIQQGNTDAARQSFKEALAADPKFPEAYIELARLALRARQWQELADCTERILQIDPGGMPQFWYLNSAANFELRKIDIAEKSALQGVRIDGSQRVPQLQFLMGVILAAKRDYRGAAEHIRNYLHLAPHARDAAIAEKQLRELERLSGEAE